MTFVLMAIVVFLGFQLFTGAGRGNTNDSRSVPTILGDLKEQNKKVDDRLAASDNNAIQQKLPDHSVREKLTPDQQKSIEVESKLLFADTKLKTGVKENSQQKITEAWQYLEKEVKGHRKSAFLTREFPVTPTKELPATTVSFESLFKSASQKLSEKNKTDLVWGIVPGYAMMDFLVKLTGSVPAFSYTFAAFLLALLVRAAIFVPVTKQLKWSKKMTQLAPLMKEITEDFQKKDPQGYRYNPEYQQKTMGLYKEYGINPAGGCLPMLIQMPIFLIIFNCMLHYRFEFEKGTFLWVSPSSHATNNFFAPNLGSTDNLLIVIYAISMLISQFLAPVSDPNNMKQTRLIGMAVAGLVSVSMFFFPLPSAFVLYWIFLNIFATIHSLWIYRQPAEPLTKVASS
jgi:YidC/Oxa1 family membrane protein insertase